MALTFVWMSACDIDGLKITTFGPKSGLVALAPSCGSADAKARPPGSTAPTAMTNRDMPTTLQRLATRRRRNEPLALLGALPLVLKSIYCCLSARLRSPWRRWAPGFRGAPANPGDAWACHF